MRIGIHTGEVQRTGGDVLGITVDGARVAAAADADGITISSTTRDLIGSMDGVDMGTTQTMALQGMAETHQVVPLAWT